MADDSISRLWEDYLFLTREMSKFIILEDMSMFSELMQQREQLQKEIEARQSDSFRLSPEGRSLLAVVKKENNELLANFQYTYNRIKNKQLVHSAYDGSGVVFSGLFFNSRG